MGGRICARGAQGGRCNDPFTARLLSFRRSEYSPDSHSGWARFRAVPQGAYPGTLHLTHALDECLNLAGLFFDNPHIATGGTRGPDIFADIRRPTRARHGAAIH